MALLRALIKTVLAVLVVVLTGAVPCAAASFSAHRGINLDAWVTWPPEKTWVDKSVLTPFPEWRRTLHEKGLRGLKADGFDFVRMPIDPAVFLSDTTAAYRDDLYSGVREAARLANAAGLKVIVDLHLMPNGGSNPAGMEQVMRDPADFRKYLAVVRHMAATLRDADPRLVALELMNEPVIDCTGAANAEWLKKLAELHAAARSEAPALTLVLSGGCWANAQGLAATDPAAIADGNVIWTFHSYSPFLVTHQGATWAGDFIGYVTGIPYPPYADGRASLDAALAKIRTRIREQAPLARRAGLLAYLDEQIADIDTPQKLKAAMDEPFETVTRWARANHIKPENILLGEFGMIRQEYQKPFVMPAAWRAAYIRDMIALAEQHGFAWSVWSFGGAFGVVRAFDGQKAEPDVLDVVRALPPSG